MIITKRSFIHTVCIVSICVLAGFLRLYGIADHTEFLADQGSAGVVIYDWYKSGEIPLVGPTTSTGQRPGPAYYYLIALPFILSNFNPVVPAIVFAIFGVLTVYLLFWISRKLWGTHIALVVGLLYAVSPAIVAQNRNMWNPTLIPFFVTLLFIAMYKAWEEDKHQYLALGAFCAGILIQLHYSNVFTLGVCFLFFLVMLAKKRWQWLGVSLLIFMFIQFPFFIYEYQHGFEDIQGVVRMFLTRQRSIHSVFLFPFRFYDVSSRLMEIILPLYHQAVFFSIFIVSVAILWIKRRTRWELFISAWLLAGIVFASSYGGVVFDHYTYFLYPFPFLLAGAVLSKVQKSKFHSLIVWICIAVVIVLQLVRSDVFAAGVGDIGRTQAVSREIMKEANGEPFSFTVLSSRSFSDYHYRFFFTIAQITPAPITTKGYDQLFLICESSDCIRPEDLVSKSTIEVMCYDHHCSLEYPKLVLADFLYESNERIHNATIYRFRRR